MSKMKRQHPQAVEESSSSVGVRRASQSGLSRSIRIVIGIIIGRRRCVIVKNSVIVKI
jgi:hypothetical protein